MYSRLVPDLLEVDNTKLCNCIRMDPDVFEELFLKVKLLVTAENTKFLPRSSVML